MSTPTETTALSHGPLNSERFAVAGKSFLTYANMPPTTIQWTEWFNTMEEAVTYFELVKSGKRDIANTAKLIAEAVHELTAEQAKMLSEMEHARIPS